MCLFNPDHMLDARADLFERLKSFGICKDLDITFADLCFIYALAHATFLWVWTLVTVHTFIDSRIMHLLPRLLSMWSITLCSRCAQLLALLITVEQEWLTFHIPKHTTPVCSIINSSTMCPQSRWTPVWGFTLCKGLHDQLQGHDVLHLCNWVHVTTCDNIQFFFHFYPLLSHMTHHLMTHVDLCWLIVTHWCFTLLLFHLLSVSFLFHDSHENTHCSCYLLF